VKGTFYLVDGTALAYRSHFAFINNPLRNSKGQETSATYGYVTALLSLLDENPDYIAVAFDVSRKTFRTDLFPEYKATRDKAPSELKRQWGDIKEITLALGIPVLELEGYEADDLIGTAAVQAAGKGLDVRIVSGDKDMMQLVSDRVTMLDLHKRSGPEVIDADGVRDKFGVEPERVTDVMGLMGDSSDNVPGVPLIGPKKATALIREFGSLDEVLARAPAGKPNKTNKNLVEFAEQARLSKQLVTIDTDAPVDVPLQRYDPDARDTETLARLFKDLEFSALYKKVARAEAAAPSGQGYSVAGTAKEVDALAAALTDTDFFAFDAVAAGTDLFDAELLGVAFAWRAGEAVYVPWDDKAAKKLAPAFADADVAKGAADAKWARHVLLSHDTPVRGLAFDPMIASYLLDPGASGYGLETMALKHLGLRKTTLESLVGKGKNAITLAEVEDDKVAHFAAENADVVLRLAEHFRPALKEMELDRLFADVEMPLVPVLGDMERAGIGLDGAYLEEMGREMEEIAHRLVEEIHDLAGEVFNINSTKQLGPILFEKLRIQEGSRKRPKRTRTGLYSTDATTLDPFADNPIVAKLFEYRAITKLKSTYVDTLPQLVHRRTGRIHCTFHQTVAATGRLACSDPNLQNIPVRTPLGRRIRKAFVADEGCKLLAADYSQIELRLMAHLSGDPGLCEVYEHGGDIHAETAARMFGLKLDEVSRDQRNSAKAINFGILYGMGPQRLARDLKITLAEAKQFLEAYFREFPGVKDFQIHAVETARANGYVTTLLGRRRAIPEVNSKEPGTRAQAENVAKNTPVQGTAADMIKVAMIRIHRRLRDEKFAARMLLQVHDELVFEVPDGEIDAVSKLVVAEMEGALELRVPIVAEVGVGDDWLEAH
jgi:DNA polymerase-1